LVTTLLQDDADAGIGYRAGLSKLPLAMFVLVCTTYTLPLRVG